jgi:hypothetical protein
LNDERHDRVRKKRVNVWAKNKGKPPSRHLKESMHEGKHHGSTPEEFVAMSQSSVVGSVPMYPARIALIPRGGSKEKRIKEFKTYF